MSVEAAKWFAMGAGLGLGVWGIGFALGIVRRTVERILNITP